MNSCIKWVGGKRLLRKQILAEFPEDYTRYVEVFGGAAWLLFARERDNRVSGVQSTGTRSLSVNGRR